MNPILSRRHWMQAVAAGAGAGSVSGWFTNFAHAFANDRNRRRHCILLWMSGGPSQTDTFDMKPNHANGGEIKEIQTSVPGLRWSECLPKLAAMADRLALIRSMSTKEGDHGRGTYLMRTGHKPMGPEQYPSIGASLANQLGRDELPLPSNVSIGSFRSINEEAFSPGFLGPRFAPLFVGAADVPGAITNSAEGFPQLQIQSLQRAADVDEQRMQQRLKFWRNLQSGFVTARHGGAAATHNQVYESAMRLMSSEDAEAFDLSKEPAALRQQYGATVFGQGCLMARRLIERGVPFIEVSLGTSSDQVGWDTHANNFNIVRQLSTTLDNGWATLMRDLDDRGLLESTTILWMGEFGRTPVINANVGRDHYPRAWTTVLAGGGIAGGQAYGKTSKDGTAVEENEVSSQDLLATLCDALGVGAASNMSPSGRPIPIAEGNVIREILA